MSSDSSSASQRILRNSFWYGLETVLETVVFIGTSIAVARYLGPEQLGHFTYINFFVGVVTRTAGTGMSSVTRKYMSEFLALEQPGKARGVYNFAYRYQLFGALFIALLGISAVVLFGQMGYRLMSVILIASLVPGVMSWVPANANQAFEDVRKNTFSAICYIVASTIVTVCTIVFHWGLVGIASALLIGRTTEVFIRTIPLHRRLRAIPLESLDGGVISRVRRYCLQAIGIQLITSVVWDRSEMIFLRAYAGFEQIAFYSISMGLAGNLLLFPRTFGSAAGITLMVEAGRDARRADSIVSNACRYLALVVLPVNIGAAVLAERAVYIVYGARYAGAVPSMILACLLVMPLAFQEIPQTLIRTADQQQGMLKWMVVTGIINMALDWLLIRHHGAVGATLGNGLAQVFGTVALWFVAKRFYTFRFPWAASLKMCLSALIMAIAAKACVMRMHGVFGLIITVTVASLVYVVAIRLLNGLNQSDRERLTPVADKVPVILRPIYLNCLSFITSSGI